MTGRCVIRDGVATRGLVNGVERSEGAPQSARRRTGRSTECDVGSPGAAGALRGKAPSSGGMSAKEKKIVLYLDREL